MNLSVSSTPEPKALVLHAYSAANVGDGLLVDLTLDLISSAAPDASVTVVATEAQTFSMLEPIQWRPRWFPDVAERPLLKRIGFLASIVLGPHRSITQKADEADVIVSVGGGYLRGGSLSPALKSLGAHFGQLSLAARHGRRAVYLPQSIGPFLPGYASLIRRRLRALRRAFVRDDRSLAFGSDVASLSRAPDLAVLQFADKFGQVPWSESINRNRITVIARELDGPRRYGDLLADLAARPETTFALQSTIGGNDDTAITSRFQPGRARSLAQVLAEGDSHVVVSTRLHGSMAALLAGHPTIHLSYERKGWGAFEDLGLEPFVLNARDATLEEVWELVDRIHDDPAGYWRASSSRLPALSEARDRVISEIREAIA